jgi:sulfur carrier protein
MSVHVILNGEERELAAGSTVASLIEVLAGRSQGGGLAVAVDGTVVPRREWARARLGDGAQVEVVVAVQGG